MAETEQKHEFPMKYITKYNNNNHNNSNNNNNNNNNNDE